MMWRWMFPAFLVFLFACSSPPPDAPVVRLVDVFDEATVDGSTTERASFPRTEWRFDRGGHRWKAGPGVSGLTVRDGRLVGRATTDVPIVHVERTSGLENPDTLHAIEVRLRVSKGSNLSMELIGSETIDFEAATRSVNGGFWSLKSPILPSEELQTYTVTASGLGPLSMDMDSGVARTVSAHAPIGVGNSTRDNSYRSSGIRHVLLRPIDEAGSEFEIESVRLIFRSEYLASIPSGVSWQGLSEIYRETLVTRSPEVARFALTLPEEPWLDLAPSERSKTLR